MSVREPIHAAAPWTCKQRVRELFVVYADGDSSEALSANVVVVSRVFQDWTVAGRPALYDLKPARWSARSMMIVGHARPLCSPTVTPDRDKHDVRAGKATLHENLGPSEMPCWSSRNRLAMRGASRSNAARR